MWEKRKRTTSCWKSALSFLWEQQHATCLVNERIRLCVEVGDSAGAHVPQEEAVQAARDGTQAVKTHGLPVDLTRTQSMRDAMPAMCT